MRTSRIAKINESAEQGGTMGTAKRMQDGRLAMPIYSDFFSSVTDNIMCSNAMYGNLLKEMKDSLFVYSEKEAIVMTVYESSSAAEETLESVIIGFKKFVTVCIGRAKATLKTHLALFLSLFLVGVLLEFLLYGAFPDALPLWVQNTLDIVAWVFVWEFAAYMAFEFVKEIKNIRQLAQIRRMEFKFRKWE